MYINGFYFSPGNTKIGKIWNFSLPPIKACAHGVPCANRKGCYALKSYMQYGNVRNAWDQNLASLTQDEHGPNQLFDAVWELLMRYRPKYFRIHVSGDFINQRNVHTWCDLASSFPKTKFRAFTKRYELDYSKCPRNLRIGFSMWPHYGTPKPGIPSAWMYDPKDVDERIPKNVFRCPGSCMKCHFCFRSNSGDVVFVKH